MKFEIPFPPGIVSYPRSSSSSLLLCLRALIYISCVEYTQNAIRTENIKNFSLLSLGWDFVRYGRQVLSKSTRSCVLIILILSFCSLFWIYQNRNRRRNNSRHRIYRRKESNAWYYNLKVNIGSDTLEYLAKILFRRSFVVRRLSCNYK